MEYVVKVKLRYLNANFDDAHVAAVYTDRGWVGFVHGPDPELGHFFIDDVAADAATLEAALFATWMNGAGVLPVLVHGVANELATTREALAVAKAGLGDHWYTRCLTRSVGSAVSAAEHRVYHLVELAIDADRRGGVDRAPLARYMKLLSETTGADLVLPPPNVTVDWVAVRASCLAALRQ